MMLSLKKFLISLNKKCKCNPILYGKISTMFRILVLFIICVLTTACASGSYKWYKPEHGMRQFTEDHMSCLNSGDFFPFSSPNVFAGSKQPDLRADWDGIWASFSPYPGAPPVNVGSPNNSFTVSKTIYKFCMKHKGYKLLDD